MALNKFRRITNTLKGLDCSSLLTISLGGFRQVWVKCSVLVPLIFKNYEQSIFLSQTSFFLFFDP
jgi:hypothetical protein